MTVAAHPRIAAIIPAKASSLRVAGKNTRPFYHGMSLTELKIRQLQQVPELSRIILNTDSENLLYMANRMGVLGRRRSPEVRHGRTPWGDVVMHLVDDVDEEHVLFAFVTTPFIGPMTYRAMIASYLSSLDTSDSLMAVAKVQTHLLDGHARPLNFGFGAGHKNSDDIEPLYALRAGAYLILTATALALHYHIGGSPRLYTLDQIQGIDIDDEDDWHLALTVARGLQQELCA